MQNEECTVLCRFLYKSCWRIFFSRSEAVTNRYREKYRQIPARSRVFCSESTLIQSESILSCLTAEKGFLLFKGRGSLKKVKHLRK
jgi:hypothetical protein